MKTIFFKELTEQLRGVRFHLLLISLVIISTLTTYLNLKRYESAVANEIQLSQSYYEEIAKHGKTFWEGFTPHGYRKANPYSIFANGVEYTLPIAVSPTAVDLQFEFPDESHDVLSSLFGFIDLLFLVQVLFSLVALIFAADAVTREKEDRTLAAILANPVSRLSFILAKLLSAFASLMILLLGTFLTSLFTLSFLASSLLTMEMITRIVIVFLLSAIYVMVFYGIGLTVSSKVYETKTAYLLTFFVWIVMILIVPRVATVAAKILMPAESSQTLQAELRYAKNNIETARDDLIESQYMSYWEKRQDKEIQVRLRGRNLPIGKGSESWEILRNIVQQVKPIFDNKMRAEFSKIKADYSNKENSQVNLALNLSRLSPFGSFTLAFTTLCNTGEFDEDNFYAAANRYRNIIEQEFYSKFVRVIGGEFTNPQINITTLPSLEYRQIPLLSSLNIVAVDFLLLAFWMLMFITFAYIQFLHYDVR